MSMLRGRNALKLWSGWPTIPMVFVKGVLISSATDLQALISNGEFKRMVLE
jgi:glutaredoxin-related protein